MKFCIGVWLINNVVMVSGGQQRDNISILLEIPFRLPLLITLSRIPCAIQGPYWLLILNRAVCTCPGEGNGDRIVREFGIDLYTPSFSCISSSPYYWLQLYELQRLYLPLTFLLVEEGDWFFSRYCLPDAKILSILQKLIQFILRLMWTQTVQTQNKTTSIASWNTPPTGRIVTFRHCILSLEICPKLLNSLALGMRFPGDSVVKNPPADAGDSGDSGLINPREEETTTHSSIPAGKSPWTEEPGGL